MIRDDNVVENVENFQIRAEFADSDTSRIVIAPENSEIVIEDNDSKFIKHNNNYF